MDNLTGKLRNMTREQAQGQLHNGQMSQDDFDHYMLHWHNETPFYEHEHELVSHCPICSQRFIDRPLGMYLVLFDFESDVIIYDSRDIRIKQPT